jgi:Leucine-rich repeat (LRR) protein
MSFSQRVIFSTTFFAVFLVLSTSYLSGQKLKLSKIRRVELDSIAKRQQADWANRNAGRVRSYEQFLDSVKQANPERYKKILQFQDSMKMRREATALRVKEMNMEQYDSLLAEPDILNETSLDLSNGLFEQIPEKVVNAQGLDSLDISNNRITNISRESIENLSLKKLNLRGNQLGLGELSLTKNTNIQQLNLGGNQLEKIPARLKRLRSLKSLSLADNQLGGNGKRLRIRRWKNLEVLNLSNNELKSIPKGLRKLKNLKKLYLNNCQLTSLKGLQKIEVIGRGRIE